MAREKLGESVRARAEYDRALDWMKQVKSKDDELRHFRAEAAELLQIINLPASKPWRIPKTNSAVVGWVERSEAHRNKRSACARLSSIPVRRPARRFRCTKRHLTRNYSQAHQCHRSIGERRFGISDCDASGGSPSPGATPFDSFSDQGSLS